MWRDLPIRRWEGGRFGFSLSPALHGPLFLIDRASGDDLLSPNAPSPLGPTLRKRINALLRRGELVPDRMRFRTMITEAADSSIMEGASATRVQALDMVRSGRRPVTRGERMILNNYEGMQLVKRSLTSPLTPGFLLELQEILTSGTLNIPDGGGRLRGVHEPVRVVDARDETEVFVPPPADAVPALLKEVCDFANAPSDAGEFLHPIIKACVLHFLIGYVHPFVDGNGRTARAVFYWCALRHGYGIFEYLSISEIIRAGFARYPQAYLDSEQDDGDLTYFILYHLDVIEQSLQHLSRHLDQEAARLQRSERFLALSKDLNLRQRLLLEHAIRHPTTQYTVKSHKNSNALAPATARADLDGLVRKRLFTTTKRAKEVIYHPAPGLPDRLARKGL